MSEYMIDLLETDSRQVAVAVFTDYFSEDAGDEYKGYISGAVHKCGGYQGSGFDYQWIVELNYEDADEMVTVVAESIDLVGNKLEVTGAVRYFTPKSNGVATRDSEIDSRFEETLTLPASLSGLIQSIDEDWRENCHWDEDKDELVTTIDSAEFHSGHYTSEDFDWDAVANIQGVWCMSREYDIEV